MCKQSLAKDWKQEATVILDVSKIPCIHTCISAYAQIVLVHISHLPQTLKKNIKSQVLFIGRRAVKKTAMFKREFESN